MSDEAQRAAESMRQYIVAHLDGEVSPAEVAKATGYSERHAARLFRDATGRGIAEYIRLLRLSAAARQLARADGNVLEVALAHRYDSHEGFTKAFTSAFGISPRAYRKGGRPIPYFIPYPVALPENMFKLKRKENAMQNAIITATVLPRPARKLVVLYSATGTDYWSFCQEKGCDWEGLLLSIPERMDLPAFLSLPADMVPSGCAAGAVGIEVPENYAGRVPEGYQLIDLPAGEMLYFQSAPYENEENFAEAIKAVFDAYEAYQPATYGYAFNTDKMPVFNFGAFADKGARIAVPMKKSE